MVDGTQATKKGKLVKQTLERILGPERFEKVRNTKAYLIAVDSLAMNTFSYFVAAPLELGVAGMDFQTHIKTRAYALVTNTIIGRPYSAWRDWLLKKLNIREDSSGLKKFLGDTAAFISFSLPVYLANLAMGGASVDEMTRASLTASFTIGAIGGPYGLYLDKFREMSGLEKTGGRSTIK